MLKRTGILVTLLALGACNDGDDTRDTGDAGDIADGLAQRGQFLDSAVQGLEYESAQSQGTTDANGGYDYVEGTGQITFSLGGLQLGTAVAAPILTPLDLQQDAADAQTSDFGLNVAQFLQTIDNDAETSNGIQITQAMRDAAADRSIDFSQTAENFADDGAVQILVADMTATRPGGASSLMERSLAIEHLTETLIEILDDVSEDLLSMVGNATCTEIAQCATVSVGHRGCGGPSWFLPFSTATTDADALESVASEHRRHYRSYVILTEAVSTCEALTPPTAMCVEGVCTAQNTLPSPL